MTTTERQLSSANRAFGAASLRLYLLALLATAYAVAWWTFAGRAPARSVALPARDQTPASRAKPRAVAWYGNLPTSARPPIQLPPGWHIVPQADLSTLRRAPADLTPVRVSPARTGRIRTRSS